MNMFKIILLVTAVCLIRPAYGKARTTRNERIMSKLMKSKLYFSAVTYAKNRLANIGQL